MKRRARKVNSIKEIKKITPIGFDANSSSEKSKMIKV